MPTTGVQTLRLDLQWRAQRAPALNRRAIIGGGLTISAEVVGGRLALKPCPGTPWPIIPMIHYLITAFVVAFAAVTASELLTRIWEYF